MSRNRVFPRSLAPTFRSWLFICRLTAVKAFAGNGSEFNDIEYYASARKGAFALTGQTARIQKWKTRPPKGSAMWLTAPVASAATPKSGV